MNDGLLDVAGSGENPPPPARHNTQRSTRIHARSAESKHALGHSGTLAQGASISTIQIVSASL